MSDPGPQPDKERTRADPAAGAESPGGRGGAYVPLPQAAAPSPPKKGLALAAGALAAVIAGLGLFQTLNVPAPASAPPVETGLAAAAKAKKVFLVGMKDLDAEATRRAREALTAGGSPSDRASQGAATPSGIVSPAATGDGARDVSRLTAPDAAPGPGIVRTDGVRGDTTEVVSPTRAKATPAQPPESSGVLDALAAAPQSVKEQVRNGTMSLFTFHFVDFVAEDGDIVGVNVDGKDLGRVTLSHSGASLTIPLKPGEQHVIRFTALHDGGGGVTFGAVSSVGRLQTKVMSVGEHDEWIIAFQSELGPR